jgi:hypothetical protein
MICRRRSGPNRCGLIGQEFSFLLILLVVIAQARGDVENAGSDPLVKTWTPLSGTAVHYNVL